jgi:hypothetical protein
VSAAECVCACVPSHAVSSCCCCCCRCCCCFAAAVVCLQGYAFCEFVEPRSIAEVISGLHMQTLERKVGVTLGRGWGHSYAGEGGGFRSILGKEGLGSTPATHQCGSGSLHTWDGVQYVQRRTTAVAY